MYLWPDAALTLPLEMPYITGYLLSALQELQGHMGHTGPLLKLTSYIRIRAFGV